MVPYARYVPSARVLKPKCVLIQRVDIFVIGNVFDIVLERHQTAHTLDTGRVIDRQTLAFGQITGTAVVKDCLFQLLFYSLSGFEERFPQIIHKQTQVESVVNSVGISRENTERFAAPVSEARYPGFSMIFGSASLISSA